MGFSLLAFCESTTAMTALDNIAPIIDQHVTVTGDDISVPSFAPNLGMLYAFGAGIAQCRVASPSLRHSLLPEVMPVDVSAEPTTGFKILSHFDRPFELTPSEGLQATVIHANTEYDTVLVWLFDAIEAAPAGEIVTVQATGTTTLTAYGWSLVPLTFSQQLEAGTYAIVGMRAASAGALAARVVLSGSPFRPGVVGYDAVSDMENDIFRNGNLGVFGTFEHSAQPQVEFLSVSADTAETVYFDLIKL